MNIYHNICYASGLEHPLFISNMQIMVMNYFKSAYNCHFYIPIPLVLFLLMGSSIMQMEYNISRHDNTLDNYI